MGFGLAAAGFRLQALRALRGCSGFINPIRLRVCGAALGSQMSGF